MSQIAAAVGGAQGTTEVLYLVALYYLEQAIRLLEDTVKSDELLSRVSTLSPGSTIGKHLRHIADHYRPLVDALEASSPPATAKSPPSPSPSSPSRTGSPSSATSRTPSSAPQPPLTINYDTRQRNGEAETSVKAAIANFRLLKERFTRATGRGKEVEPDREVVLTVVTPIELEVLSTFARELYFASFHTVHHFALVRCVPCPSLSTAELLTDALFNSQGDRVR